MVRRVTDVFGISGPVPFLNVDVDTDNELFLDPSAIRNGTGKYAARAHKKLVDFFTEVVTCARSSSSADQTRGRQLLQRMHEPNETRLGYSSGPARGHGFGTEMGSRLWDEIVANRTLHSSTGSSISAQAAVLSRLERVPLFIKRVDKDMISDLTTRVIFNVLHDFTQDMIAAYPSIGAHQVSDQYPVWDVKRGTLVDVGLTLPAVGGAPLLLVPKNWVYWRLVMDPDAFYNRFATQTIQDEQTTYASDGRAMRPSKDSIKKQNKDIKGTNIRQAVKFAAEHERDLAAEYEAQIDAEFEPMTEDDIRRRLNIEG